MIQKCKIIVYHYVRPIKISKHPNIRGLELDDFIKQLNYLKKRFSFLTVDQFFDCIYHEKIIPDNSIMLTFDDGLKDHYKYVFPLLKEIGLQGLFFPSGKPLEEHKILDVHKIQFILSRCNNIQEIITKIREFIETHNKEYRLESFETYYSKFASYDRFDSSNITFIKNMLQKVLPIKLRYELTDNLFKQYVSKDEESFMDELYLSFDEINEMRDEGMYFGSHGYSHEWLSNLSDNELDIEISKSLNFYSKINSRNNLIMCYPYGDYTEFTIQKLKDAGFKAGLTTKSGDAELDIKNIFTLKRHDTNDFPK
jgi:peptidoglycan/xylan/chitin deacetylase (PgdA/CDA1 family)